MHAWQFVPESFAELIGNLNALGLTSFKITNIWNTPINNLEFFVTLTKSPGADAK